jgi:hypothetical protein
MTLREDRLDIIDRWLAEIDGLPGVRKSRPSTVTTNDGFGTVTHIAQTFTIDSKVGWADAGNYALVQTVSAEGSTRVLLPPKVTSALYRQRQSLVRRARGEAARRRWEGMTEDERAASVKRLRAKTA